MIHGEEWAMIRNYYQKGLNKSEIARMLGIDRKTVRRALNNPAIPVYKRKIKGSKLTPFTNHIDSRLEFYNLTSQKLFREIKAQGYNGGYGILNKYVRKKKQDFHQKTVLRFETLPGEQAQVDWGYFGKFYDCEQKKWMRLCCFLMVLGYSRMRFIHFFDGDSTENFLMGHNLAFQYFGGYPKEILYDNLKSVVIKRAFKQKDSEFNKKFLEFSGFYGFRAILARPYRPQTKGKVENTVRYVREDFFAGEEFNSLRSINFKALEWAKRVNSQIHHTTHERPIERLKKENLSLYHCLYDLSRVYYRKVFLDSHFSFQGNFYSVSPEYVRREVSIKLINSRIKVYYRNNLITEHEIAPGKASYITLPQHYSQIKSAALKQNRTKPQNTKSIDFSYSFCSINTVQFYAQVEKRDLSIYEKVI